MKYLRRTDFNVVEASSHFFEKMNNYLNNKNDLEHFPVFILYSIEKYQNEKKNPKNVA